MGNIKVTGCGIEGLYVIEPEVREDERGYFTETYNFRDMKEKGLDMVFVQDNQSKSKRGVLRGLHFQWRHSQDKLVRVLSGEVYDVAVDLRPDSGTFGKWQGFTLSAKNREMLYLPKGFAHGFLAREDNTVVHYLCGDRYDPGSEDGILWNDPKLGIGWPLDPGEAPLLSERDQGFQTFWEFKQSLLKSMPRETGGNEIG